jgi:hypothetical protein
LLGAEISGNYKGECEDIQPQYLHYPKFKREGAPTLREASGRPTYLSMDVQKTNTGNFQFGSVTYVVAPSPTSQFFVVPFDTGVYVLHTAHSILHICTQSTAHVHSNHVCSHLIMHTAGMRAITCESMGSSPSAPSTTSCTCCSRTSTRSGEMELRKTTA